MKICIFGDARSPHIQRLCPALAVLGNDVHVVCHHPVPILGATVEKFRVPPAGLRNPRRWNGRFHKYLLDFLRNFDIVNVQFLHDWGFTPEMLDGGCFVATAWGSDIVAPPGEEPPSEELRRLRVALLRRASAVTVCGPQFAGMVVQFAGIPLEDISVVPFGVDTNLFKPSEAQSVYKNDYQNGYDNGYDKQSRDREGAVSCAKTDRFLTGAALKEPSRIDTKPAGGDPIGGEPIVGFLKGFRPVYGPDVWMAAIPRVLDGCPHVSFEMLGDGEMRESCQATARRDGVDHKITWRDTMANWRVPEMLGRWALSVIPSHFEAFGVAALESSAMCVPVVASNVVGLRDTVIDGSTGLLVQPGDADALADAVINLVGDDDKRALMGRSGRAFVQEHYELGAVSRIWHQTFEEALDRSAVTV